MKFLVSIESGWRHTRTNYMKQILITILYEILRGIQLAKKFDAISPKLGGAQSPELFYSKTQIEGTYTEGG